MPDKTFWSAGGTPETHLVPPFCGAGEAAVATKHFLSASVHVESVSGERGQYGATGA